MAYNSGDVEWVYSAHCVCLVKAYKVVFFYVTPNVLMHVVQYVIDIFISLQCRIFMVCDLSVPKLSQQVNSN